MKNHGLDFPFFFFSHSGKIITPAVALPQLVRKKLKELQFYPSTAPAPATISISHVTDHISPPSNRLEFLLFLHLKLGRLGKHQC